MSYPYCLATEPLSFDQTHFELHITESISCLLGEAFLRPSEFCRSEASSLLGLGNVEGLKFKIFAEELMPRWVWSVQDVLGTPPIIR